MLSSSPRRSPEAGASSQPPPHMARNQALEEPAHSLGGCLDPGDVLKLQVTVSSLSRVAGMRRPHRPASMKHRPHAEPGTCVTEQRTYFQGTRRVIPSAPSAAGVLGAPAGLPASHWGADSLDGGGFPCKADCVLTKSVFPGFWGPCPMAAEPALPARVS